jgi:hypothetical protein
MASLMTALAAQFHCSTLPSMGACTSRFSPYSGGLGRPPATVDTTPAGSTKELADRADEDRSDLLLECEPLERDPLAEADADPELTEHEPELLDKGEVVPAGLA